MTTKPKSVWWKADTQGVWHMHRTTDDSTNGFIGWATRECDKTSASLDLDSRGEVRRGMPDVGACHVCRRVALSTGDGGVASAPLCETCVGAERARLAFDLSEALRVPVDVTTGIPKDPRNAPLENVLWGRRGGQGFWHVWVESEDDDATVKRACDAFEGDGLSLFVDSFPPGNATRERRESRANCHTCDALWSWFRFFDGKETGRDRKDDARRIERDALLAAKRRLTDENVSLAEKLRGRDEKNARLSERCGRLQRALRDVAGVAAPYAEGTDGRTRYGYVQRTDGQYFPFRAVCTMCPGEGMTLVKRALPDNAVLALSEHVSRRHMGSVPVVDDATGERYARCTVRGCSHSERSATIDVRKAIVDHEIREHGRSS